MKEDELYFGVFIPPVTPQVAIRLLVYGPVGSKNSIFVLKRLSNLGKDIPNALYYKNWYIITEVRGVLILQISMRTRRTCLGDSGRAETGMNLHAQRTQRLLW